MKTIKFIILFFVISLSSCVSRFVDKKDSTELITSSIGGYLGYQFSDGDIFTTVLGSTGGLLLGSFIGDYFLKDDYYFYKKELLYILDDNSIGSKGYWKNHKSGNEGVIIVKDYFNNPHCRIIEHVYVNKNKPESFFDTACRENNGSWNVIR